jgi:alpha-L-arabinofuranosidase
MSVLLLLAGNDYAQINNSITIYPDHFIKQVSPLMTGACVEDVNHEIYGGLYSQMIFGESFQESPMDVQQFKNPDFNGLSGLLSCSASRDVMKGESEMRSWLPVKKGTATGSFALDHVHPFVGTQSQNVVFVNGKGAIGIENRGLNRQGLSFKENQLYEGSICVRSANITRLFIAIQREDGSVTYAHSSILVNSKRWKKYSFMVRCDVPVAKAQLSITLHQPGAVCLGYVLLQPGSWGLYKGLPVRKDVVEGLIKEKLTALRYGGSMILANAYRWKNMIGPREKRRPYKGTWYPFSTNGWGIIDFLNLCEAAGFTAIPTFNSNETPGDMADFIAYTNGSENTLWGRKRIADGHPAPYHLKYIELGNEQYNNAKLTAQFRKLSDAMWRKDPSIQIIYCMSDNTREDVSGDLKYFKQTIKHSIEKGHEAWFDVHVFNNEESEPNLVDFEFAEKQLGSIAAHKDFKLCVFEENANNARMKRGLAHANAINRLQRLPYDVPIVCAANGLQVDKQNDNGWDQGLLFFNQDHVWGQPSFYVTQMISDDYLPDVVKTTFTTQQDTLDITARINKRSKEISLQVVNHKSKSVNTQITINSAKNLIGSVSVAELKAAGLDDWNTIDSPDRIVPLRKQITIKNNVCEYTFAPYSFTIMRFNAK